VNVDQVEPLNRVTAAFINGHSRYLRTQELRRSPNRPQDVLAGAVNPDDGCAPLSMLMGSQSAPTERAKLPSKLQSAADALQAVTAIQRAIANRVLTKFFIPN